MFDSDEKSVKLTFFDGTVCLTRLQVNFRATVNIQTFFLLSKLLRNSLTVKVLWGSKKDPVRLLKFCFSIGGWEGRGVGALHPLLQFFPQAYIVKKLKLITLPKKKYSV